MWAIVSFSVGLKNLRMPPFVRSCSSDSPSDAGSEGGGGESEPTEDNSDESSDAILYFRCLLVLCWEGKNRRSVLRSTVEMCGLGRTKESGVGT